MREPTMISSGKTFERETIQRYLKNKKTTAAEYREEDSDFDEEYHFICPITRKPINKDWLMPNKRIKLACQDFLRENPWAFDQEPSQSFRATLIDVRDDN